VRQLDPRAERGESLQVLIDGTRADGAAAGE